MALFLKCSNLLKSYSGDPKYTTDIILGDDICQEKNPKILQV